MKKDRHRGGRARATCARDVRARRARATCAHVARARGRETVHKSARARARDGAQVRARTRLCVCYIYIYIYIYIYLLYGGDNKNAVHTTPGWMSKHEEIQAKEIS